MDLAFSYFQKADRNKRNDYRSGYLYLVHKREKRLLFALAHTPIMTTFFKNNFDYETFRSIITNTAQYRDEHYLRYKKMGVQDEKFRTPDLKVFLNKLDELEISGFTKSVFAKSKSGKTGVGNVFGICLASGCNEEEIVKAIEKSWDLFLWLYPTRPIFKRNASLNRSLQSIDRKCEIARIKNLPKSILKKSCSGQVQGAHIIPHKQGGSDKLQNGVWLCSAHHRLTEGKLNGTRGIDKFEVKYGR
ncbi:MAG: HNH endonuclease [Deltaproteobacteria bacterium]|nr:HNH endonuclease [Deltaproteobacteria bacterium]